MKELNLQPTLRGELLELRPLRESDFEALFLAASDPLIWEQHPNSDRYQPEVFKKFFADAIHSGGALAIIDLATGALIGSSRYYVEPVRSDGALVIGYTFLSRSYWGGPYNKELKELMLEHAFTKHEAVEFHVDEKNVRSRQAMLKIGARAQGSYLKPTSQGIRHTLIFVVQRAWPEWARSRQWGVRDSKT